MARLYILLAFVLTAPVLLWAAEDAPAPTPEETTLMLSAMKLLISPSRCWMDPPLQVVERSDSHSF